MRPRSPRSPREPTQRGRRGRRISDEDLKIAIADRKEARAMARAKWVKDHPQDHAKEQHALAGNQKRISARNS